MTPKAEAKKLTYYQLFNLTYKHCSLCKMIYGNKVCILCEFLRDFWTEPHSAEIRKKLSHET